MSVKQNGFDAVEFGFIGWELAFEDALHLL